MQKISLLAVAGAVSLGSTLLAPAAVAEGETIPVVTEATAGEITGKVAIVNTEKRMLTIQKPDGSFQVIHVPDEVKRLDEIKINDKLTISYLEAVAVDLQKGTAAGAPAAVATTNVDREPGKKPAGTITDTVTVTGTVEAVNKANSTVTIQGPDEKVNVTVKDPALLKEISVGDSVTATFIKSVAATVE
jgi:hypothetical protein